MSENRCNATDIEVAYCQLGGVDISDRRSNQDETVDRPPVGGELPRSFCALIGEAIPAFDFTVVIRGVLFMYGLPRGTVNATKNQVPSDLAIQQVQRGRRELEL